MCANAVLVYACLKSLLLFAWRLWRGRAGCHSGMQLVHQALPEHASLGAIVVALRGGASRDRHGTQRYYRVHIDMLDRVLTAQMYKKLWGKSVQKLVDSLNRRRSQASSPGPTLLTIHT